MPDVLKVWVSSFLCFPLVSSAPTFVIQNLTLCFANKLVFFMLCAWYEDWYQHNIICSPEAAVLCKRGPISRAKCWDMNGNLFLKWLKWHYSHWEPHIITRSLLKRDVVVTLLWACLHFHSVPSFISVTYHSSWHFKIILSGIQLPSCLWTHTYIQQLKELQSPYLARNPRSCCYRDQ